MDEFTVEHTMPRSWWRADGAARCWTVARQYVVGLSLAIACQSALAQAMYRLKPLGYMDGCTSVYPQANGFNRADQVTGEACNATGQGHAFLWKKGAPMVDLGPSEAGSGSYGVGINASGLVAGNGYNSTGNFAFVSSGDGTPMRTIPDGLGGSLVGAFALNDLGQVTGDAYTTGNSALHAFVWKNDGSPMRDLGTLGGNFSNGEAINASGQIAGKSDLPDNTTQHAFIWKNDGTPMLDLGSLAGVYSYASFINASGQVTVGSYLQKTRTFHLFFWRNDGTPMQNLGTLGGTNSVASALNDAGQIAGTSDTRRNRLATQRRPHAFVWRNDGARMQDLGTLGGTQSSANDMNSSGQVTGYANLAGDTVLHAFLWRNDGTKIQDLNTLIDPTDPLRPYVTLTNGHFVNDRGDIVADGTDSRTGVTAPYLLQGTVLTLAPRSIAFGNQPINTTSAAKSVTVTNTSPKTVAITSIGLTGSAPGQFASTNSCGKSLTGHATCTIKVTFKPATAGAKSALLNLNGGGGGLRSVSLTGTGK